MQITNIQSINFNAHHKNVTKPILPPNTITIRNFHEVDETLMRGAKPNQEQLQELKNMVVCQKRLNGQTNLV